jgi:DNA-binding LacI/PurR family transcriptional regulator
MFSDIEDASADDVQTAVENFGNVDGVVIITPIESEIYDDLATACKGTPYVQIGTRIGSNTPSVVIDQMYGSQMATQHLIDQGHRHIAEISGPLHWHDALARHTGWFNTLETNGLEPASSVQADWTAAGGYAAVTRLLTQATPFTGLIVGNDQMALGAIRALRENGLSIPGDVSIIGFDDIPEAAFFEPPLSTVRQDFLALGKQSVEYLVEMIRQPQPPLHQRVLYPTFIERSSTSPRG